jgi:hypothetical protein
MKFSGKAFLASGAAAMLVAAPLPSFAASIGAKTDTASAQTSDYYGRRHRHRDRVDAGDVLTGIGILAGIAILAGAASNSDKKERNEPRYDDRDYDRSEEAPVYRDNDLGAAVTLCTEAAERSAGNGTRVREVTSVTSESNGWRVQGQLDGDNARGFDCSAVNGRVDYVRLDDGSI